MNPTFKFGNSATKMYRDNADNNKTVFTNNSIDILKISGTGGQDTIDVTGNINISTNYDISGTTVLNSTTLGSGIVNSSLTSVGNLTSLTVDGDLTVNGTMTTVDTANLTIEDSLMKLANKNTGDSVDTGFYSLYNDGVSRYSGLFRDATDGVFKLFTGTTIEPTTTVDTSVPSGYLEASLYVGELTAKSTVLDGDLTVDTNTLYVDSTNNFVGIGNIVPNSKLQITHNEVSSTSSLAALTTTNGDGATNYTKAQVALGHNGTDDYPHFIHTRHSSGGDTNNAIDFYTCDGSTNGVFPTNATLNLSMNGGNVGVNNTSPSYHMDVSGDINTTNEYRINSTSVLNATTLGSGVVNSSLTSVGTLDSLSVAGLTTFVDLGVVNSLGVTNDAIVQGKIGVGSDATPTNYLHLSVSDSSNSSQVTIHNESDVSKAGLSLNTGLTNFNIQLDANTQEAIIDNLNGDIGYYAKDAGDHRFYTTDSNTERFTILNDGNVGIGTPAPNTMLELSETTPIIRLTDDRTNSGGDGTQLGGIEFYNSDSSGVPGGYSIHAKIHSTASGGSVKPPGRLVFETYTHGDNNPTGMMTMNHQGNVGIGITVASYELDIVGESLRVDSNSTSTSQIRLETTNTSGRALFRNDGGDVFVGDCDNNGGICYLRAGGSTLARLLPNGNFGIGISPSYQLQLSTNSAAKPTSSSWTISSDRRLKNNIVDADMDICYNDIKNLQLRKFTWNDKYIEAHSIEDTTNLGFIAQEVELLYPKSVTTKIGLNDKYGLEDVKSVDKDQLIMSLFGATKKLMEKVESLEAKLSLTMISDNIMTII